ncbi:CRISPR-associated helicase Cas3' [Streptomyces sp. NPDC059063]|uniref:CRISPR-associated helicase Cas3' n=1 Tax=unclassified Streptomyces TaxID=2593676 RepID=UPI0036D035C5
MWGKQRGLLRPYPVICHLLDTAAVFGVLWDGLLGDSVRERIACTLALPVGEARVVLSFWAGLHDLGKITPPFQAQVPEAFASVREDPRYAFAPGAVDERAFRHEIATHWALAHLLEGAGYPGDRRRMRQAVSHQVAQLLGGHHGCFGRVLLAKELDAASDYQPGLGEEGWAVQREVHFAQLRRVIGADAVPAQGLTAELAVIVSSLVVVADWLASQKEAIIPRLPPESWRATPGELDTHWEHVCKVAPGLVSRAQLGRARFDAEQFGAMFSFTPNALQGDLADRLPQLVAAGGTGLLLVTAPTGDGKTEAALYAASVLGRAAGARGLYFALPTMATADAMFPRVRRFAQAAMGGERAMTLLHSMAWLSPLYAGDAGFAEGERLSDGEISGDAETATAAGAWLRGHKRGLLAPLGAGTIDQVLSGVLPLTHNSLRLFGLSDKVLVVDEAHAYGPWMHQLLIRLLEWLGAFHAPVVLLSATLTGRTATSLVDAYRRGAGFTEPSAVEPCYPGWLFTDVATGSVSPPHATGSERARRIDVNVRSVVWDTEADPARAPRPGGRREALREALRPVVSEGGTALVCCTTVAEAQQTYRDLRGAFPGLAGRQGGLRLLHSRYPARVRQRITAECETAYGKPCGEQDVAQPRPGSVLVATQVVEQSLDLDFDLIVSDLAPLAQLLQRAGRGRRHERGETGRPCWALPEDEPRLVVLEPVSSDGVTTVPRSWGSVYDAGLLRRTALILTDSQGEGIDVPGDVQHLVDTVYAQDFVDRLAGAAEQEQQRILDAERQAEEMAQTHLAARVGISAPADVAGDLHRLSRREAGVTEELLTTRLGADTGRVLCLYEQSDGSLTLDEAGVHPLPEGGHGLCRGQLAEIMSHVAPVPGKWLRGGEGHAAPGGWAEQPLLRDLVLLRMRQELDQKVTIGWSCQHGDRTIRTSDVGLEAAQP